MGIIQLKRKCLQTCRWGRQQNGFEASEITQLLYNMWVTKNKNKWKKRKQKKKRRKTVCLFNNLITWLTITTEGGRQASQLAAPLRTPWISLFSAHFPPRFLLSAFRCNYCVSVVLTDDCSTLFYVYPSFFPRSFPPRLHFLASILNAKHVCGLATKKKYIKKRDDQWEKLTSWNKEKP